MKNTFQLEKVVDKLSHYLPSQSPLKDFIHHNTLHAFQHDSFHEGLKKSSELFGYKTYLQLSEYRQLFQEGKNYLLYLPWNCSGMVSEKKGTLPRIQVHNISLFLIN